MFSQFFFRAILVPFLLFTGLANAQDSYRYSVDLNKLTDDKLQVELLTPRVKGATAVFAFPKIIPGTYAISDYGKFISNVKAFDKAGKALAVTKQGENQWKISGAAALARISYTVEDIFDTRQKHNVYPMAATDFEKDSVYVLHTPGVFGFIDGLNKLPFEVTVQKPSQFYGATALVPQHTTPSQDVFRVDNLDELYDSPIMYTRPDTATVQVGNAQVLVSVFSPNHKLHAKEMAGWMNDLLLAAKNYLGGKLPTDRYAFLFYFRDRAANHSFPYGLGGALEHNTSSFYYLFEAEPAQMKDRLVDIAAHEFFHIITPLTISSKEVKEFNFNEAVLSKHLWLYEGVTEYTAHHVQVKYGLNTPQQFLDKLSEKITNSRTQFNDTLSFTTMSKESAGKYKDEYNNVYEKGALIAAVLDVYLLHLSDGNYGLRNLTYDLGIRFGKERYFNDDSLFDEIGKLTYPEIKAFLLKHVHGGEPIPYDYYFGLAGVKFSPVSENKTMSFGGFSADVNDKGQLVVGKSSKLNEFGQKLGYHTGDVLYAFNGASITPTNFGLVIDSLRKVLKEGEPFEVKVGRLNAEGKEEPMTLRGVVTMVTTTEKNKLEFIPSPSKKQELVRKAWLTPAKPELAATYEANSADVASIDALLKATYEVISGPAGARNWQRFYSLFLPEARMGASMQRPNGTTVFRSFTPAEYQRNNAPHFLQQGFYEEELGRDVTEFGNLAHVRSAYQYRFAPGAKVEQRGINYFTLVKAEGRWWISQLVWQNEGKETPIPSTMIKK
ncbi:M61 family metallopeptidase [Flavisolibacter nicotianae]|uniref:M61 family metallopeptidase n=1 Tax=Flavisolibacter nicotianae TaxID=2364882 RepID=UPI000EAEF16B|nr:peptidase M61 [Flavisolibacter nicotianae]